MTYFEFKVNNKIEIIYLFQKLGYTRLKFAPLLNMARMYGEAFLFHPGSNSKDQVFIPRLLLI